MPMEDLLTRQAPHSQEAEQSVLGSMLIDSRCISDVVGVVRPEDFYLQANREIYETMYECSAIRRSSTRSPCSINARPGRL